MNGAARALRYKRGTLALGAGALGLTGAVLGGEVVRIWRRGSTPRPGQTVGLIDVGVGVARETVAVAVAGYEGGTRREHALLNTLGSYMITAGIVRVSTHVIRRRGTWGPFRNLHVGSSHVHHFVPGDRASRSSPAGRRSCCATSASGRCSRSPSARAWR